MIVPLDELTTKVNRFLELSGLKDEDASSLTGLVVEQTIIGNRFSAVGELPGKHSRMINDEKSAKEEVVVDKNSAMLVKGNGRMAPLITADHQDEIVAKAKKQGIYAFGIYDSTYNEFFEVFCRRIAAQDCIAIIVENGGPQGVVPFGGREDITGTNPLAYGIPTNEHPIVFDAATAMHAYGAIKLAKEKKEKLPDNAYVDKNGNITTDPEVAYAVLPFGGFKGYAINLLIDVLTGALVRGKSGLDQPVDSQRYIGTFIIVIDPASFGDLVDFKKSTSKLVADILAVKPVDPSKPVKVPGMRGAEQIDKAEREGKVEIDDEDWKKFTGALEKLES
jgi:L-2-hydroxycarboxylate dehydrogenase (NAD+)